MTRWPVLLVALALAFTPVPAAAAPAAATPVLPPESSVVVPPAQVAPVNASLRRLGTLRVPGIGLYAPVYYWGCGNAVVPNLALRWGCVGSNNKFIVGHAYGVFHAYYLAYARHRLTTGLVATFTDTAGHATRYRLSWVRLVPKSYVWRGLTGERWAWNNTSTPTLTLQTCWGSTNAYRIVTRFTRG